VLLVSADQLRVERIEKLHAELQEHFGSKIHSVSLVLIPQFNRSLYACYVVPISQLIGE
jgi:hypothetical protein